MKSLAQVIEEIADEAGAKVLVDQHRHGLAVRFRRGEWFVSEKDMWGHIETGTCPELLAGLRTWFWLQKSDGLVVGVAGKRRSKFRRQAH